MRIVYCLCSALLLYSCTGNTPEKDVQLQQETKPLPKTEVVGTPTSSPAAPVQNLGPANMQPVPSPVAPAGAVGGMQVQKNSAGQITDAGMKIPKGMNPPHGQPGHRCDIAVGAPLSSAPAPTAQPAPTVQKNTAQTAGPAGFISQPVDPTQKAQAQQAANNNVGPMPDVNPAHGQPWHRCDIAVGTPLKATAAKDSAH